MNIWKNGIELTLSLFTYTVKQITKKTSIKLTKLKSEEIDINPPLDMYQIRTYTILNSTFQILDKPFIILTLGTWSHQIIKCTQMNTQNNAVIRMLKK